MKNYISVYNCKTGDRFCTSMPFFDQELIRHISDTQIIFKRVNIDWNGKTYKFTKDGNLRNGRLPSYILKGKYPLNEEESDEDTLVFNLEDRYE